MAVTSMDDAAFSYRMIRDTSATTTVVQDVVSGPTTLYSVAIVVSLCPRGWHSGYDEPCECSSS